MFAPRLMASRCALVFAALLLAHASALAEVDGEWTSRLGLSAYHDECQEERGLKRLLAWVAELVGGGSRRLRSAQCETKEVVCGPGELVTGLQVRYARLEKGDRDFYDFRARCGQKWQPWLGLKFDSGAADHTQLEMGVCEAGVAISGVQVMRGRVEFADKDYYNFKLRCGETWAASPLGLTFDGFVETRSATCRNGRGLRGLRVHRGFQDWGDVDTYEFQLLCSGAARSGARRLGVAGEVGADATRGGAGSAGGAGGASGAPRFEEDELGLDAYGNPLAASGGAAASDAVSDAAARERVKAELNAAVGSRDSARLQRAIAAAERLGSGVAAERLGGLAAAKAKAEVESAAEAQADGVGFAAADDGFAPRYAPIIATDSDAGAAPRGRAGGAGAGKAGGVPVGPGGPGGRSGPTSGKKSAGTFGARAAEADALLEELRASRKAGAAGGARKMRTEL